MSSSLFFILAVILAYSGVFLIFKRDRISLLVGFEYLFVGFLLSFLEINTSPLKPLLYPFLCWIGMLMGLQLRFTDLRQLNRELYSAVFMYTASIFVLFSIIFYLLGFQSQACIIGIAFCSVCYRTSAQFLSTNDVRDRFALFFVSFIPFVTICYLLLYYALTSPAVTNGITLALIAISAIMSRFLLATVEDQNSIILLLIGIIILIAEICAVFTISPLVIGFFTGIYLTNFCYWKKIIFLTVYRDEKQLFMLFLILLGLLAGMEISTGILIHVVLVAGVVIALKFLILKLNVVKLKDFNFFLFLAPGGFTLVLLTDFWLRRGGQPMSDWLSVLFMSVVILQVLGVIFSRKRIK